MPFEQAQAFDELCFAEPVIVDPTPVSFLADTWPGERIYNYYVGGVGLHRFYRHSALRGGSHMELSLAGTTVEARTLRYFAGPETIYFAMITKDPHALVVLDVLADLEVVAELELELEPTSFTDFELDPDASTRALAVADVEANLHTFELDPMGMLSLTSTRALPEPLDELDAIPWLWEEGLNVSNTQLLGRSNATLTAWHLSPPIADIGPIDAHLLPAAISVWHLGPFSHVMGDTSTLLISTDPSEAVRRQLFEFAEPGNSMALAHPVERTSSGYVPWGLGGLFMLSRVDARIAHLATGYGGGTDFEQTHHWIAAPADTQDFLAVGELGFLCASTSAGLLLVSPSR
ncbi:MAG TPA: hypothetical protein VM869_07260 [Enhygromyxa sp.]|nr:hypothetical protein [Enhygromyxa sp.]